MAEATLSEHRTSLSPAQLAARHGLHVAGDRPSLPAYVRQLWSYRHFMTAYSSAKTAAQFANVGLGQLWQVLTPLANAAVYFLIFGLVLKTSHQVTNFIGYLCIGIFLFSFTASVVQNGVSSITSNLNLIRALHFPRAALPLTVTMTQVQQLFASTAVLLVILLMTKEPITWRWLLLPVALLLQALFNGGLALIVARLGSKMTDLKQLVPFIMRTWLYASGIFYSITIFTNNLPAWLAKIFLLNPLLVYVGLARELLLREDSKNPMPEAQQWLAGGIWAVVILVIGFVYFWRGEKEYGRG